MAGTPAHFYMLAFSAFLIVATLWVDGRFNIHRGLACLVLGVWVVMQGWFLWPGHLRLHESLPLHVCDIASLVGPMGLLWRWRWARTLVVFWGIGLTTQGFITPVVRSGPGAPMFWLFWANHIAVLLIALDEVVVRGYRPGRRDVAAAIGMSGGYVAAMFALDAATGWNYGFVGPDQPGATATALVLFGPWPWRVLWLSLATAGWFVLLGWVMGRLPGGETMDHHPSPPGGEVGRGAGA